MQVMLADTTETPKDSTETAVNWRIALHNLKLKNVSVDLQMPLDSMALGAISEMQASRMRMSTSNASSMAGGGLRLRNPL